MKTTHLLSSIIITVVAWLAPMRHAQAQGLLQVTFDRESWPTEEAQRTIVLPVGMTQVQLGAGYTGGDTFQSYAFMPAVSYGVLPNITIGASYTPTEFSIHDEFSNMDSSSSTLSAGSVFAIARPFNSYDLGLRVEVPVILDEPIVNLDVRLVGRLAVALDTVSWFFSAGVIANVYNDTPPSEFSDDPFPTQYVADTYLACQLNSQMSLSPGLSFRYDGDHPNAQLYGRVQFAIDHQFDLFGMAGYGLVHDNNGPFVTVGANIWL